MSVIVHGIIAFAIFLAGALLLLWSVTPAPAAAQASAPPALTEILEVDTASARQVDVTFADETRRRAMATAARAWGAQAGTRHRGWEIGVILERYAPQLHGIYRFRDLMIREAGFMVQPPVLAETRDAFILARDHSAAASARRVVRILAAERIVSTVPTWRDFLERSWPEPTPPAAILFPADREEEELWEAWVTEGWESGTRLAGEIFSDDLDRLNGIFTGIILWHRLEIAGMVTSPDVATRAAAATGTGTTLRIAERFVTIDSAARLVADPGAWRAIGTAP